MVAALTPEREYRTAGCSERCRVERVFRPGAFGRFELLVHDPESHEAYGAWQADPRGQVRTGLVVTGPLTIDMDRYEASVDGRVLHLTPTEFRLLGALARRCGTTVTQTVLLADVWGPDWLLAGTVTGVHALRVNVSRLRSALGQAGGLLVTVTAVGHRLELLAPGAPPPATRKRQQTKLGSAWAVAYERCRGCWSTDRSHTGRGYCTACYARRFRAGAVDDAPPVLPPLPSALPAIGDAWAGPSHPDIVAHGTERPTHPSDKETAS